MKKNLFINDFKKNVLFRIDESSRMIHLSLEALSHEDIWKKPNSNLNSIGNLMLHLCGNMRQYIIASLGNLPDVRNRSAEFEAEENFSKEQLLSMLEQTVAEAKMTIETVTEEELLKVRLVQGFSLSGIGIVIHVVEHYSYHTGQIAFWVKLMKGKDLGFYKNINLDIKNQ